MPIKITYLVACDACGREAAGSSDKHTDCLELAWDEGYKYERVPNGSWWYFCPKCYSAYKEGEVI